MGKLQDALTKLKTGDSDDSAIAAAQAIVKLLDKSSEAKEAYAKWIELKPVLEAIAAATTAVAQSQQVVVSLLRSLLSKDLVQVRTETVRFPAVQKVSGEVTVMNMDRPAPQVSVDVRSVVEALRSLEETMVTHHEEMMGMMRVPEEKEERTFNVTPKRANPRWIKAMSTDSTLTGDIDGSNTDFYLPSVPIKNSETVRLNMGAPLSSGIDYTLTSNKITFTIAPPLESQIEVRYQTR